MNMFFLTAGIIAALVTVLHVIAGGKAIARPLLSADKIHPVVKYTHYYCWHLVSISLTLLAAMFIWAAYHETAIELAVIGTIQATGFTLWGLLLAPSVGQQYRDMPQGWLFLPVTMFGMLGIFI